VTNLAWAAGANRQRVLRADLLLLVAALVWGFGFVAQRVGTEVIPPFSFNAIRFAMGAVLLAPLIFMRGQRRSSVDLTSSLKSATIRPKVILWGGGAAAGLLVAVAVNFQQFGIATTTAGKAGFITGMYMVLVPFLGYFVHHRPGWRSWMGALISALGLFFLSVGSDFSVAPGDLLLLACAITFAFQVLLVGWLSPCSDPLQLAWVEFFFCAVFCAIGALLFEHITWQAVSDGLVPLLYSGIASVAIGYTLQVVGQRDANPTHASILMNMEAVFAALGGWLILGEVLNGRALLGCALMFVGMLLA
jgi:drug/metabolite transporter (DMT)-like permease